MAWLKQRDPETSAVFARNQAILLLVTMTSLATAVACSETPSSDSSATLTVLATSSLTESFNKIAEAYEQAHPDIDVVLSFGGSPALALQVQSGSPAQVLATADLATMDRALDGLDTPKDPAVFAKNDLVIAVAAGNPRDITDLADLTAPGLIVSRCAPAVPCGKLADAALTAAGVTLTGTSEAADVKAAFAPLIAGQADAALVYRTDVQSATGVDLVDLPADVAQRTGYPIVALDDSAAAQDFVEYVQSAAAATILANHGFTLP